MQLLPGTDLRMRPGPRRGELRVIGFSEKRVRDTRVKNHAQPPILSPDKENPHNRLSAEPEADRPSVPEIGKEASIFTRMLDQARI